MGLDPGERRDRVRRARVAAAGVAEVHRVGECADDRHPVHRRARERQRRRIVLQQDDRLALDRERQRGVRGTLDDRGWVERRPAVEDAKAELGAQDAAHRIVDHVDRHLPPFTASSSGCP